MSLSGGPRNEMLVQFKNQKKQSIDLKKSKPQFIEPQISKLQNQLILGPQKWSEDRVIDSQRSNHLAIGKPMVGLSPNDNKMDEEEIEYSTEEEVFLPKAPPPMREKESESSIDQNLSLQQQQTDVVTKGSTTKSARVPPLQLSKLTDQDQIQKKQQQQFEHQTQRESVSDDENEEGNQSEQHFIDHGYNFCQPQEIQKSQIDMQDEEEVTFDDQNSSNLQIQVQFQEELPQNERKVGQFKINEFQAGRIDFITQKQYQVNKLGKPSKQIEQNQLTKKGPQQYLPMKRRGINLSQHPMGISSPKSPISPSSPHSPKTFRSSNLKLKQTGVEIRRSSHFTSESIVLERSQVKKVQASRVAKGGELVNGQQSQIREINQSQEKNNKQVFRSQSKLGSIQQSNDLHKILNGDTVFEKAKVWQGIHQEGHKSITRIFANLSPTFQGKKNRRAVPQVNKDDRKQSQNKLDRAKGSLVSYSMNQETKQNIQLNSARSHYSNQNELITLSHQNNFIQTSRNNQKLSVMLVSKGNHKIKVKSDHQNAVKFIRQQPHPNDTAIHEDSFVRELNAEAKYKKNGMLSARTNEDGENQQKPKFMRSQRGLYNLTQAVSQTPEDQLSSEDLSKKRFHIVGEDEGRAKVAEEHWETNKVRSISRFDVIDGKQEEQENILRASNLYAVRGGETGQKATSLLQIYQKNTQTKGKQSLSHYDQTTSFRNSKVNVSSGKLVQQEKFSLIKSSIKKGQHVFQISNTSVINNSDEKANNSFLRHSERPTIFNQIPTDSTSIRNQTKKEFLESTAVSVVENEINLEKPVGHEARITKLKKIILMGNCEPSIRGSRGGTVSDQKNKSLKINGLFTTKINNIPIVFTQESQRKLAQINENLKKTSVSLIRNPQDVQINFQNSPLPQIRSTPIKQMDYGTTVLNQNPISEVVSSINGSGPSSIHNIESIGPSVGKRKRPKESKQESPQGELVSPAMQHASRIPQSQKMISFVQKNTDDLRPRDSSELEVLQHLPCNGCKCDDNRSNYASVGSHSAKGCRISQEWIKKVFKQGFHFLSNFKVYRSYFMAQRDLCFFIDDSIDHSHDEKKRFSNPNPLFQHDKKELLEHDSDLIEQHEQLLVDIDVDIERTFTDQDYFQLDSTKAAMRRILIALSNYEQGVGYVQGMNYIAGVLLYHAGEIQAFWLLSSLMDNFNFKDLLLPGMPGFYMHNNLLEQKFQELLPTLHQHFEKHDVQLSYVSTDWLLSLFLNFLPIDLTGQFLNAFFEKGWDVFYKTALGVLKYYEQQLLKLNDCGQIVGLLKQARFQECSDHLLSLSTHRLESLKIEEQIEHNYGLSEFKKITSSSSIYDSQYYKSERDNSIQKQEERYNENESDVQKVKQRKIMNKQERRKVEKFKMWESILQSIIK